MILRNSSNQPIKIDNYTVIEQLGHGGFGTVYHVRDNDSNEYALKLLHKAYNVVRIKKHLQTLSVLNTSPLFLKAYSSKKLLDKFYILMEYAPYKNVHKLVKKEKLSEEEATKVLLSMLESLKFLHERNIIHGDIKAENIVKKDDSYFLIDYDLSQRALNVKTLHIQNDDDFTAPEIYRGYQSDASDIYSLGCTLYFLLTSEHIYNFDKKSDFSSKMFAHLYQEAKQNSVISSKMFYLIQRMTDKNEVSRITGEEIKNVLENDISTYKVLERTSEEKPKSELERYTFMSNDGVSYAQNVLGLIYEDGNDVQKDLSKAFELYSMAQKQGLAKATINLALCYKYAKGCQQDYTKARELFIQAAEQNHSRAYFYLGDIYENALGVQKDLEKAKKYYKKAAEYGYKLAYKKLKELL